MGSGQREAQNGGGTTGNPVRAGGGEAGSAEPSAGIRADAPAPPTPPQEPGGGFDNKAFEQDNWAPAPSPAPELTLPAAPPTPPPPPAPFSPEPPGHAPQSPAVAQDGGGPAGVRSILTKERRPEGGYKAVWFGGDSGAEADVVVLNTPAADADGASDSGSEDSGDEDADAYPGWGPHGDASGDNSTYI